MSEIFIIEKGEQMFQTLLFFSQGFVKKEWPHMAPNLPTKELELPFFVQTKTAVLRSLDCFS